MIRVDARTLVREEAPAPDIDSIYRNYSAAVTRWAGRLAGPELETEDVVQEVFMIAHRKLSSFRGEAAVGTWLYRITERVVSHRRRRERLKRWFFLADNDERSETPTRTPSPLEALEQRHAAHLIYEALDALNENHRSAFILFEIEELSGQQIATLKGVSLSTVWVWLHRGRTRFLERLAELEKRGSA